MEQPGGDRPEDVLDGICKWPAYIKKEHRQPRCADLYVYHAGVRHPEEPRFLEAERKPVDPGARDGACVL